MTYYYQLIFLGDTGAAAYDAIRGLFFKRLQELGVDDSCVKVIKAENFDIDYSNCQPAFVFFLGNAAERDKNLKELNVLLENGDTIYPLYFGDGTFEQETPECIREMNGHQYLVQELDKYVNYALESLRLLRKTRKVFISYRRSDSSAVANQLFDLLTRRNFDVFLDSYVIRGADNFQEELFHRMSDCDVLVQLNTNDFKKSKWCRAEVEMANMKQIGLIEVIWPNSRLERWSELCYPYQLKADDFRRKRFKNNKSILKNSVLNAITRDVESVRARNLAARQDNLAGEFVKEAKKLGRSIVQELYYLLEATEKGTRLYLPAVGIPSAFDYYESLDFKKLLQNQELEIYLLYDELRIREKWINHLDWLDLSLEVKSIKKKDFATWLQEH